MAFFGGQSKSSINTKVIDDNGSSLKKEITEDYIKTPTNEVSILKPLLKSKGNIEGSGSLIIGGIFDGDIFIENCVVIEKGSKVNAVIRAKNVKIAGKFDGTIYATSVEVTNEGDFNGYINSNKTFLGGKVKGIIKSADSIEITNSGIVNANECKSKNIKIVGKLNGKVIASELLEITSGGSVDGTIITKGIKTEQGGSVVGNIQTYDENIHGNDNFSDTTSESKVIVDLNEEQLKKYAKKKVVANS